METLTDSFAAGVVKKRYILGRNDESDIGVLHLGKYLALDRSTGSHVALDALKPHAILICGKRGYGKSYTMGTLIEELSLLQPDIRENIASLVIDTMGIFWTLRRGNEQQPELLSEWGLQPTGFDVNVFVPAGSVEQYRNRHIDVKPFSIPISHLGGYEWCKLFRVDEVSALGVLLVRVIGNLKQQMSVFSFDDIIDGIMEDERSDIVTKSAAENHFKAATSWGVFEREGVGISELIRGGVTSVLDVSTLTNHTVRAAVVGIIGKDIYEKRLEARRSYERMMMGDTDVEKGIPMVWMFIDEAHLFIPSDEDTLASNVIINEWLRQGRQPGLTIIFATQRPAAIHPDVISQCDVVMCHRLTARDDISALEAIRPTYMREDIGDSIRKMGLERGIALIVDDTSESAHIVKMRPRYSWHGGNEPSALMEKERSK
ncbi:MAG: ATP-binding protein [Methanosarcinaceae archaeon]|nr:ATP-binding protein [Methanosarcinaceae archaeon]MDF1533490.1 ATP-binding protein [Methanosarcinaceae archaeon]